MTNKKTFASLKPKRDAGAAPDKGADIVALPLAARLLACAERLGGKRALAEAAGLSESQLFRYLNGDSEMSAAKAVALARAARVDVGWLLTGSGTPDATMEKDPRPTFRAGLLRDLSQCLEEVMVDYQHRLGPRLKSRYLSLIYDALRLEERRQGQDWKPNRAEVLAFLDFLTGIRDDEGLDLLQRFWDWHAGDHTHPMSPNEAEEVVQLIRQGMAGRFNGMSGEVDYRQMTQTVKQQGAARLQELMAALHEDMRRHRAPALLLDIGFGNGRDLLFLHQSWPDLALTGIDLAVRAVTLGAQLEASGRLPEGTCQQGDMHCLPCADGSVGIVQARFTLCHTPWLEGHACGIESVLKELHRVLAPGGRVFAHVFEGSGVVLLPYFQLYTREEFAALAEKHGFAVEAWQPYNGQKIMESYGSEVKLLSPFHRLAKVVLRRGAL